MKPIGNVSSHHNFWFGILQKRHSGKYDQKNSPITDVTQLADDQIAKNYWNEIEDSVGRWEHLVQSLEIIERLTDDPVTPSHNKPLNKTIRKILG